MENKPYAPEPWLAWLTPVIFVACIAMFVYTMHVNNCPWNTGADKCILSRPLGRYSFQPWSENHLLGPSISTLSSLGGLERKDVVENGEKYRLLSCMWLHAGVIHLIINMTSLVLVGFRLEQEFGFLRIAPLYLLSGVGGSILSCVHQEGKKETVSVGASGALFGMLGAMFSELIANWTIYANKCMALSVLGFVITVNLSFGFIPGVDNSAHIGGFISGVLLGFVLFVRPQYGYVSKKYIAAGYDVKHRKPKYKSYQLLCWIISLILLVVG
ncbi:Rhomboid-like protein [Melia azedarach]|uniref:Rhomboid-like protein n=1 Tax=Melia azedarach TaxID=155640 RepID=A0ACC1Y3U0_MELAZ|nr:Rhomboid-like protein [Melia azedarach]